MRTAAAILAPYVCLPFQASLAGDGAARGHALVRIPDPAAL